MSVIYESLLVGKLEPTRNQKHSQPKSLILQTLPTLKVKIKLKKKEQYGTTLNSYHSKFVVCLHLNCKTGRQEEQWKIPDFIQLTYPWRSNFAIDSGIKRQLINCTM